MQFMVDLRFAQNFSPPQAEVEQQRQKNSQISFSQRERQANQQKFLISHVEKCCRACDEIFLSHLLARAVVRFRCRMNLIMSELFSLLPPQLQDERASSFLVVVRPGSATKFPS
jgi:hypothetical protein